MLNLISVILNLGQPLFSNRGASSTFG
uniref:Uncharacterized protein n=1 Tax=Anguilla anguilla TaxID=7936 RepID=A0A0E9QZJ0_ANGAN